MDHENRASISHVLENGDQEIQLFELPTPTAFELRFTLTTIAACHGSLIDEDLWLTHVTGPNGECELTLMDLNTNTVLESGPFSVDGTLLAFKFPVAVVAFENHVEFVDVNTAEAVASFELPGADSARIEDDVVSVRHAGGVARISPPCGP